MDHPNVLIEETQDEVFVITMQSFTNNKGEFENRFNMKMVEELNRALDTILHEGGRAVVITGGKSKFFSNGHDVGWLETEFNSGKSSDFITAYYVLLARFMAYPLPTVAALNGHAFAGGCLLALAQDYRVMSTGKGFICMNEIDMISENKPSVESLIKPGAFKDADRKMMAVVRCKVNKSVKRDMFLQGLRMDGKSALQTGLVDYISDNPIETAVALARKLGEKAFKRNRKTIATLKFEMAREYIDILTDRNADTALFHTLSKL
jgi:enoyl-CoA hydratase/carnithine racemase